MLAPGVLILHPLEAFVEVKVVRADYPNPSISLILSLVLKYRIDLKGL